MKNQYIGDIGDYGKYSLLKTFSDNGISVGINWYLTKDDETGNDGRITDYLDDEKYRCLSPKVFDLMKALVDKIDKSVDDIATSDIIKDAEYYTDYLETNLLEWRARKEKRDRWFKNSMKCLSKCDLLFCDPDNGSIDENRIRRFNSEKYVSLKELEQYYNKGKNIVYYCQRGRRKEEIWNLKKNEMEYLASVSLRSLTFHKGTQRAYIFLIHHEDANEYDDIIKRFLNAGWGNWDPPIFTMG